jgi:hypothetical protein
MLNNLKEKYFKWKAKNLYCRTYIRFNAIVRFKNGTIKVLNYNNYIIDSMNAFRYLTYKNIITDRNYRDYYVQDIDYFMALPMEYKELYDIEFKNNYYTDMSIELINKINFKNRKIVPYIKDENIIEKEENLYDVEAWLRRFNKQDIINI